MKPVERVTRTIEFRRPDRVPFLSIIPAISDIFYVTYYPARDWQPAKGHYPNINHLLYLIGNWRARPPLPLNWASSGKPREDEFGCIWQAPKADAIGEVVGNPLESWDALETFKIPDPYAKGRFDSFKLYMKLLGRDKFVIGDLGNGIWERSHFLRGFENIMMDIVTEPDRVKRLLDRLIDEWYLGLIDQHASLGQHGVIMLDDWGTQANLMVSPDTWREIFKPRYKRLIDAAHDRGMKFMLHSCGDIRLIMDDLVEIGLDVIQKDDMECLGLDWIHQNMAGKLTFCGPLDLQRVLPKAGPEDIRREVKRTIRLVGPHNGGLIGMIYSQPQAVNIPWEKFIMMHYYYHRYGKYPVKN